MYAPRPASGNPMLGLNQRGAGSWDLSHKRDRGEKGIGGGVAVEREGSSEVVVVDLHLGAEESSSN